MTTRRHEKHPAASGFICFGRPHVMVRFRRDRAKGRARLPAKVPTVTDGSSVFAVDLCNGTSFNMVKKYSFTREIGHFCKYDPYRGEIHGMQEIP